MSGGASQTSGIGGSPPSPSPALREFNIVHRRSIDTLTKRRTALHPKRVFVLLLPPSLRQLLKRWVAAAKEIFICWATV